MADIRIKDLTTPASSTASDDFIAVDGTTNGTRKLNAFSPTFGGNATVTGTLTANSAITGPTLAPGVNTAAHYFTAYGATTSWPLRLSTIYDSNYVDQYLTLNGTLTGSRATPTFTGAAVGGSFIRSNGENSVLSVGTFVSGAGAAINTVAVFNPTNVTIPQTTASTTTSSGALVVGNGTSGGLGVGGNIHLGGDLNLNSASGQIIVSGTGNTANSKEVRLYRSDGGDWAVFGLTGTAYAGSFTGLGNSEAFIYNANPFRIFIGTAATNRFDFTSSQFKINATTASTSTSSGALVVSGGVGVAKSINAGESGSTHNFTGGDGGSGSTIFAIKDNAGANKVLVSGVGAVAIDGSLSITTSSNAFRITTAQTPASASATGTSGTICWDTSYIYVCTATNTWKRVAISTW
jgi:hypothetical protein